ncbi:hypothetical protein DL96DRAFT_1587794 [Flagelloscypha sp. PMI_526]|nr:hypothetical protein DL96DRAFT_1587794 [Flagelloscypha sp. PMI_526]
MTESTHGSLNSRWFWRDPLQQNTCTPLSLEWLWDSSDNKVTVELSITQHLVTQIDPPSSSSVGTASSTVGGGVTLHRRATPTQTLDGSFQTSIVESITANTESYLYKSIAVPQGWYQIVAYAPDGTIDKRTDSFFVWNGTDISCLGQLSSAPTTSSTNSTSAPANSTSSNKSEPNKTGIIAGAAVGGVATPNLPSHSKAPTTEDHFSERIRTLELTMENMRREMEGLRGTEGPPGYQHESSVDDADRIQELETRTESLRRELDHLRDTAVPPGYQSDVGVQSEGESVYFLDEKPNV